MIGIATKFKPAPQAFEVARRAGFRRAEIWTDAETLLDHRAVARLAERYPFDYAVHFPNRIDQPPEVVAAAADLYRQLDAKALVMHQPHQDRYAAALSDLCPGIKLAVENHRLTREQFEAWATNNPGLTLDVEHLWWMTLPGEPLSRVLEEIRSFLSRFAHKLHHVHLPGYWPGTGEHRPMYCSRDLVRGTWDLLEEVGFTGLIVSEVNVEFQNVQDLTMDVLLFERWKLDRQGL
jgi:sugar phosphate isomerase/epimerase